MRPWINHCLACGSKVNRIMIRNVSSLDGTGLVYYVRIDQVACLHTRMHGPFSAKKEGTSARSHDFNSAVSSQQSAVSSQQSAVSTQSPAVDKKPKLQCKSEKPQSAIRYTHKLLRTDEWVLRILMHRCISRQGKLYSMDDTDYIGLYGVRPSVCLSAGLPATGWHPLCLWGPSSSSVQLGTATPQ